MAQLPDTLEGDLEQYNFQTGFDFPISIYDRPSLAITNLLMRGDVDAFTKSILAPQRLTPSQLQTFQTALLKGRKKNPLIKTLLDVTTNPLFIIGMIASLKFPVNKGSMQALQEVIAGTTQSVKSFGELRSYIHSAFANLREMPGMFSFLGDMAGNTASLIRKYSKPIQEATESLTKKLGKIDSPMMYVPGLVSEGWNLPDSYLTKVIPSLKGRILAPGLQGRVAPDVWKWAGKVKSTVKNMWTDNISPEALKEMIQVQKDLGTKGISVGGPQENYWSHVIRVPRYILRGSKSVRSPMAEEEITKALSKTSVYGALRKRMFQSIPNPKELQTMMEAGFIAPDVPTHVINYLDDLAKHGKGILNKAVEIAQNYQHGSPQQMEAVTKYLTSSFSKKGSNIAAIVGGNMKMVEGTMAEVADDLIRAMAKPDRLNNVIQTVVDDLMLPPTYSLNMNVLARYIPKMAETITWHVPQYTDVGRIAPYKEQFADLFSKVPPIVRNGWPGRYLQNEILPIMRGFKLPFQKRMQVAFGEQKYRAFRWLQDHPMFEKTLPKGTHQWLLNYFGESPEFGATGISNQVSDLFYTSALGFTNIMPTVANSTQNFVTTLNALGPANMGRGLKMLGPRLKDYIDDVVKGIPTQKAFEKAFPDFVNATKRTGVPLGEMLAGEMLRQKNILGAPAGSWEKARNILLSPFGASETFNWLWAFYSGKATSLHYAAKVTPDVIANAEKFGAALAGITQFAPGPLGTPRGLLQVPPIMRQFTRFPLKMVDFLASTTRFGPDPTRRWWGGIGRAVAGSTAAYYGLKNIAGVNADRMLLAGALPLPQFEGSPFYPFPVVPPIAQLIGSGVQGLATGDYKNLQRSSWLFMPGGIGLRRLYKNLAPRYVDYNKRDEQGNIPVYNEQGALIQNVSPMTLVLRALGLGPTSQVEEYGAAKWLLSQRDRIREYRRKYLEAMSQNNLRAADNVNHDFMKEYPELGPLQMRKQDIQSIYDRREINRLDRILRGFPTQYRPLFQQMVTEASLVRSAQNAENQFSLQ